MPQLEYLVIAVGDAVQKSVRHSRFKWKTAGKLLASHRKYVHGAGKTTSVCLSRSQFISVSLLNDNTQIEERKDCLIIKTVNHE